MKHKNVCLWLFLFSFLSTFSAMAQTAGTGALMGTLKDPSGGVVPNATVTATNVDTGQARNSTTGSDGTYKFDLLPPGDYRVRIEATGFQPVEVPAVKVTVTETAVLDRNLQVGSQTQTVTVEGDVEAIQTSSSTLGSVVDTRTVAALPLSTRNYTNLLAMSAGASADVVNSATLGKASSVISVNGANVGQNNYMQDGASVSVWQSFGTNAESTAVGSFGTPNPDSIQEFKIQTSTYDAGYGRNPGAVVNVVTKSGTNEFHGALFEFFRNTALNANDYFQNASGGPKLPLNQNEFGGVIGGPIKKDKLFFFASYQETRQRNGVSGFGYSQATLPPIPLGDRGSCALSATSESLCDPLTQAFATQLAANVCPTTHPNVGNNKFDSLTTTGSINPCNPANINPVALRILQMKLPNGNYLFPSSGGNPGDPANWGYLNKTFSDIATFNDHQAMGNWDYVINSKNTLSGRYYYETDPLTGAFAARGTSTTASNALPGNPVTTTKWNHAALLRLTTLLSNNLVNEARVSYQRVIVTANPLNGFTNSQVGITNITPGLDNFDDFNISGLWNTSGTNSTYFVNVRSNQFELADQISWAHGKHSVRAGFEVERVQANSSSPSPVGTYTFGSFNDFLIGRAACPANSVGCNAGNPGASNGVSASNIQTFAGFGASAFDYKGRPLFLSSFVQDDLKVNSRLTLNLGVRWEYDGFPSEEFGNFTDLWPSLVNSQPIPGSGCVINGVSLGAGASGTGCSMVGFIVPSNYKGPLPSGVYVNPLPFQAQRAAPLNDFAPRIGFAWQPTGSQRWVVRGGAGYFYELVNGSNMQEFPMRNTPGRVPIAVAPQSTLANPAILPGAYPGPPGGYGFTPRWLDPATLQSSNLSFNNMAQDLTVPVTYEWSLNTQYEFLRNTVLELGYVGSHGIHQMQGGAGGSNGGGNDPFNWAYLYSASNPGPYGVTTNTIANVPERVQNIGVTPTASQYGTSSSYKYNGLQATVRKRMSHGIQLEGSYSWNSAFQTTPQGINTAPYEVLQMARSTVYHPQRVIVNYTWDLPFPHAAGILGKLAEGWSLSGVTIIQQGTPLTLYDSSGGRVFYGTKAPNPVIAGAQLCNGITTANIVTSGRIEDRLNGYFNGGSSIFCPVPVLGTGPGNPTGYGNLGQGDLLGPGQKNWDISISKTTRRSERQSIEFRGEFFNAFNHPIFNMPEVLIGQLNNALDVSNGSFGKITSTAVNPRFVQLALKFLF
jgi:Carboxypeptidase regulatory-like domain